MYLVRDPNTETRAGLLRWKEFQKSKWKPTPKSRSNEMNTPEIVSVRVTRFGKELVLSVEEVTPMCRSVSSAIISLVTILILCASSLPTTAQGGSATLVVDANRLECPGAPFRTISAAVAAAATGDTIEICAGTYAEQITIIKSLTLKAAAGAGVTVIPPAIVITLKEIIAGGGVGRVIVAPLITAMVRVSGPVSVTIEGMTISGLTVVELPFVTTIVAGTGIQVDGEASVTIRNNVIHDNGVGIRVGRFAENARGTATIEGNIIYGYLKAGIVASNFGSSATITNNRIVGSGPTSAIGQNGIEVADGATATIRGNQLQDNFYLNPPPPPSPSALCPTPTEPSASAGGCVGISATGILFFKAGSIVDQGALGSQNTFSGNQTNVMIF